jgi:hypothetical protein
MGRQLRAWAGIIKHLYNLFMKSWDVSLKKRELSLNKAMHP